MKPATQKKSLPTSVVSMECVPDKNTLSHTLYRSIVSLTRFAILLYDSSMDTCMQTVIMN